MIKDFPPDRPQPPAWITVPLSGIYGLGAKWYHGRHDRRTPARLSVPVISVGNIVVGGTGKTPTVIALAKLLRELEPILREQNRIAILSRGYGRSSRDLVEVDASLTWEKAGDEPLLIKRALPEAAVVVHANRVASGRHAVENLGSRVILLDDGFQYRHLHRDLDMVLIDGEQPLGNGYLLPAGPLREASADLARASLLVGVGDSREHASLLATQFGKLFQPAIPQMRLPSPLQDGSTQRIVALASIARPERFVKSLRNKGLNIVAEELFADHHHFTMADLKGIVTRTDAVKADFVVTTAKDAIRIPEWPSKIPLLKAGLEINFVNDEVLRGILTRIISIK